MKYLSICSGIEAATVAWHPLGWEPVAFAEIEAFPAAVLAHHYPGVPNLGDMTKINGEQYRDVDVLVGGTPCQAFSIAGLRKGLVDPRGNLTLTFAKLADDMQVPWVVWENVPGVLSTKDNAFGCFLGFLAGEDCPLEPPGKRWADAGCVYGPKRAIAWRVLDAQYFALAQRRRRVFVVASAREGFDPAAVLFEFEGVRRDTPPCREARQTAPTIPARSTGGGGLGTDFDCDGGTICVATGQAGAEIGADMAPTLNCNHEAPYVAHSLRGEGFDASEDGTGRGTPLVPHVVGALACNTGPNGHDAGNFACNPAVDAGHVLPVAVAFHQTQDPISSTDGSTHALGCGSTGGQASVAVAQPVMYAIQAGALRVNPASGPNGVGVQADHAYTLEARAEVQAVAFAENSRAELRLEGGDGSRCGALSTGGGKPGQGVPMVATTARVRRITPLEAERLMGFPDNYTAIPWRKKPASECPDRPRYKALGNSMAVPCMRWIGQRIQSTINHR